MATVNFSVPADVKKIYKAFAHRNKSAVIAELMREAVHREKLLAARKQAMDRLLTLREATAPVRGSAIRRARRLGRA